MRLVERAEPRERPLVAVPVVDVDFDVGGAGVAGWDEEAAADFGNGGGEGRVGEDDVEEAGGFWKKVGSVF